MKFQAFMVSPFTFKNATDTLKNATRLVFGYM
jgi:hypothetical protein